MADPQDRDTLQPTTGADITPPPADAAFEPAAPLKDTGADFTPEEAGTTDSAPAPKGIEGAKQALIDGTAKVRAEAGEKARTFAEENKGKATEALGQFSTLLNDAATQVDEKLGAQYGQYARSAADRVQSFSASIDDKTVDDLLDDARALVRKAPAVAIGTAAALGFVVARVLTSGLDQRDT